MTLAQPPLPPLGSDPWTPTADSNPAADSRFQQRPLSPRLIWPKQGGASCSRRLSRLPGRGEEGSEPSPSASGQRGSVASGAAESTRAGRVRSPPTRPTPAPLRSPAGPLSPADRRAREPPQSLWLECPDSAGPKGEYILQNTTTDGCRWTQLLRPGEQWAACIERAPLSEGGGWVVSAPVDGGEPVCVLRSLRPCDGWPDEATGWEQPSRPTDGSPQQWNPVGKASVRRMLWGYPIGATVTTTREVREGDVKEGRCLLGAGRQAAVVGPWPADPNRMCVSYDGDMIPVQRGDVVPSEDITVRGFPVGQAVRATRPISVGGSLVADVGGQGIVRGPSSSRDSTRVRVQFGGRDGEMVNVATGQIEPQPPQGGPDSGRGRLSVAPESPRGRGPPGSGLARGAGAALQGAARGGCERTRGVLSRLSRRRGLDQAYEKAGAEAEARAQKVSTDPAAQFQECGLRRRTAAGCTAPLQTDVRTTRPGTIHWQREGCGCTVCLHLTAPNVELTPQEGAGILDWAVTLRARWQPNCKGTDLPELSETGVAAMLRAAAAVLRRVGSQLRPLVQPQQQQQQGNSPLAVLERRATGQGAALGEEEAAATAWQLALLELEAADGIERVAACALYTAEPPRPPGLVDMAQALVADKHDHDRQRVTMPQDVRDRHTAGLRMLRPLLQRLDELCAALRPWQLRRVAPVMRHTPTCCSRKYRVAHAVLCAMPTVATGRKEYADALRAGAPGTHFIILSESAVQVDFAIAAPAEREFIIPSSVLLDVESRLSDALLMKLSPSSERSSARADVVVLQERPEGGRSRAMSETVEFRLKAIHESRGLYDDLLRTFVEPPVKLLDGATARLFAHVNWFLQSEQTRALMLTGGGGAGKSTAALAAIARLLDTPGAPVPIYVSLPKVDGLLTTDQALVRYLERSFQGVADQQFSVRLTKVPVLLVLDALDEVPGAGEALQRGKPLVYRAGLDPSEWVNMRFVCVVRSDFMLQHQLSPERLFGDARVPFAQAQPRQLVRMTPSGFRAGRESESDESKRGAINRFVGQVLRTEGNNVIVRWRHPDLGGPPKHLDGVPLARERAEPREWWDGDAKPVLEGAVSEVRVLGLDGPAVRRYVDAVTTVEAEQLTRRLYETHDLRAALSQVRCARPLEAGSLLHAAVQAEDMGCVVVDVPASGHSTHGMAPGPCPPMLDVACRSVQLSPLRNAPAAPDSPKRVAYPAVESMGRRLASLDRRAEGAAHATAPNLLGGGWAVSQRGAWCQMRLSAAPSGHHLVAGIVLRGGGPHLGRERDRPESFVVQCSVDGEHWETAHEYSDEVFEKGDRVWATFECFPGRVATIREPTAREARAARGLRERLVVDDGDGHPTALSANRLTKDLIGRGDPEVAVAHRFPRKVPATFVRIKPLRHRGALRVGLVVAGSGQPPAGALSLREARDAFARRAAEQTLAALERERERLQLSPDDLSPLMVSMIVSCASQPGGDNVTSRWLRSHIGPAPATEGGSGARSGCASEAARQSASLAFAKGLACAMHLEGVLHAKVGDFFNRRINGEPPARARAMARVLPLLCEGGDWEDDAFFQWRHRDLPAHLVSEVLSDAAGPVHAPGTSYLRHIRFAGVPVSFRDAVLGDVVRATPSGFLSGKERFFGTVMDKGPDTITIRWNPPDDGGPQLRVHLRRDSDDTFDRRESQAEELPREREETREWWDSQAKASSMRIFDPVYRRAGGSASGLLCAAGAWSVEYVQLALERGAQPLCHDAHQRTLLHYAAVSGCAEVVQELCRSALGAAEHYRRAGGRAALQPHAFIDTIDKDHKQTALHLAVQSGHCDVVVALLAQGADITARDSNEETPIALAVAAAQHALNLDPAALKAGEVPSFTAAKTGPGRAGAAGGRSEQQRRAVCVLHALFHFIAVPAIAVAGASAAVAAGRGAKSSRPRHHGAPA
eukprot:TRINITY_DN7117_c0_g1_i1.p1 TRINITY_DN7117_c0_g1~~TRINITY_DN7117_c0_g1_i1.p1  ORF type:complete len:1937 (+),score=531.57 TRINITY_DN7117_c0_g1_i1:112-5922(+)